MKTFSPVKVMFLCTGNSCRSQMAEGLARELGKGVCEPFSAGLLADPRAIEVMKEIGIDLSRQKSKAIDADLVRKMDIIITLCTDAEEACPGTLRRFSDCIGPSRTRLGPGGSRGEVLKEFRRARDKIKERVESSYRQ